MKSHFVKAFVALGMAASVAGCMAPDDGAPVAESDSELGMDPGFFDFATLCTVGGVQMHCCPDGFAMTGIHVNDNVLRCSRLQQGFSGSASLDAGTVRNNMHACPFGQLMVGVHVNRNLLACRSPVQGLGLEIIDAGTTAVLPINGGHTDIHVCPNTLAMAGIHVNNNLFTCDQ
jgi:hypothetical protein